MTGHQTRKGDHRMPSTDHDIDMQTEHMEHEPLPPVTNGPAPPRLTLNASKPRMLLGPVFTG